MIGRISNDFEIVQAVLDGALDRFEELVATHRKRVFQLLGTRLPLDEIEAIAQDVFLAAFQSLKTYVPRQPFENWISRIALRRCADYWRKCGRNREIPESQLSEEQRHWLEQAGANERHDREEKLETARETLNLVMDKLEADDRMLVDLVYLSGMPLRETAAVMEWSLANTKVRAMRARRKMRGIIKTLLEDEK